MNYPVAGHNSEAVLALINRRIAQRGAKYDDGRRLGLIVEGGGMRGVLSAGTLYALDLLGCQNVFDDVYATSAGGVNAAYFLSGQGGLGISVYFDDISSLRFVNPLRFWKILDVDYVYDHIVPTAKKLDETAIRNGRSDFYLGLTDVLTGDNTIVDVKTSPFSIAKILKATSAIPVLYNRTVGLGEARYVDGGLSDLLPIARAAASGCTDLLVVTTKPATKVSKRPPYWEQAVFFTMMGHRHPKVQRAYATSFERTMLSRSYMQGRRTIADMNIATIDPTPAALTVGRITLNRRVLVDGAYQMALHTAHILGQSTEGIEAAFKRISGRDEAR